jgi:hypothetical protein
MLIPLDFPPMSAGGRYRCAGAIVDDTGARRLVAEGMEVMPADAETAERLAVRLDAAGNDVRAAMFRRWAGKEFADADTVTPKQLGAIQKGLPPVDDASSDAITKLEPAPSPDAGEPPGQPGARAQPRAPVPPDDQSAQVRRMLDEAGDDRVQLERLAFRVGAKTEPRWSIARIRNAISDAAAIRIATGKQALSD